MTLEEYNKANGTNYLSRSDVAKKLGLGKRMVDLYIKRKELIAYKVGRNVGIKPEDFEKFKNEYRTPKEI